MKLSARCIVCILVLSSILTHLWSCMSEYAGAQTALIGGDYLVNRTDLHGVFYVIVYREDDQWYALPELIDNPAKLELVNSDPYTFQADFKNMGKYELIFSQVENGYYQLLSMTSKNFDIRMEGKRDESDIQSLRAYANQAAGEYNYRTPLQLSDGLQTGSIYQTNLDTIALSAMINHILADYNYMHSLLVIKDGNLVVEEYFNGWDPVRLHRLQSVTKSVTSSLVGLALSKELIKGIEDPIYKYLPHYDSLLTGKKRDITIEHLLSMTAGFEWNEETTYYADPEKCDANLAGASGDFIGYVLNKPLATEPGEQFCYNSGYPNILGHIICSRSNKNILEFALDNFFGPLDIRRATWMWIFGDKQYRPACAGGLKLTSRDMAKIGLLYLRGGVWNGRQLLDNDFVRASTTGRVDAGYGRGYGYLWKTIHSLDGKYEMSYASGTGGQYIVCIPDLDAVVVTTAKSNTDKGDAVAMLLLQELLPALAGS